MTEFFTAVVVFFAGALAASILFAATWSDAKVAHHKDAYNEYGQLTCEICKALAEKGAK